jgi:hypothetical protein
MHLSTRIQDKRDELPLINCLTDLALEADVSGFDYNLSGPKAWLLSA